jgi:hypothetical protein
MVPFLVAGVDRCACAVRLRRADGRGSAGTPCTVPHTAHRTRARGETRRRDAGRGTRAGRGAANGEAEGAEARTHQQRTRLARVSLRKHSKSLHLMRDARFVIFLPAEHFSAHSETAVRLHSGGVSFSGVARRSRPPLPRPVAAT